MEGGGRERRGARTTRGARRGVQGRWARRAVLEQAMVLSPGRAVLSSTCSAHLEMFYRWSGGAGTSKRSRGEEVFGEASQTFVFRDPNVDESPFVGGGFPGVITLTESAM